MLKSLSFTARFLRGKIHLGRSLALAFSSIAGLTGCPQAQTPIALPAGANGLLYLSQDHTQVIHLGGATGSSLSEFDGWIDRDRETLQWVTKWGVDKPWCSMVGPRSDLDWEALKAEGTQKPSTRLSCLGSDGTKLPSVDLPAVFTRAQVDPSGKSVVLFNAPDSEAEENLFFFEGETRPGALFNPKLAAVVDLASGQVRTLSVEGFGARIEGLLFPSLASGENQVEVGGKTRRLASFWAREELVIIDLDEPELSQVAVSVRTATDNETPPLLRLIPSGGGVKDPMILVASRSRDLDQIRLRPREGQPSSLDADYSILTTAAPARDFELVQIDQEPWLLSATPLGMSMVHLNSSRETLIEGMGSLRELRTYVDKSGKTMVLGVPDFGNSISTIDPAKALTSLGRQPQIHRFGHELRRVLSLDNNRVAVLGVDALTVIDLESGKATPLAGVDGTGSVTYSGGDYLYLLTDISEEYERKPALVRIQLQTMLPESQPLSDNVNGAFRFVKLNEGKGLGIPMYQDDSNDFGLGYIDVNSASLSDFSVTWFSLK